MILMWCRQQEYHFHYKISISIYFKILGLHYSERVAQHQRPICVGFHAHLLQYAFCEDDYRTSLQQGRVGVDPHEHLRIHPIDKNFIFEYLNQK